MVQMTMNPVVRPPAAVLWDMDGTLIDSEPLWLAAELNMLRRYGLDLTDEVRDSLVGSGLQAAARLFQDLGVPLTSEEIIAEWAAGVIAGLSEQEPQWRPGAIELLFSLRDAGIPFGLVTMAIREIADAVLAMLPDGLEFASVLGGDEVTKEKPDPEPYLLGAKMLGVRIEDCVALEDSGTGVRSARASGAVTFGIPNLLPLDAAPAHELWPTLAGVDADHLTQRFRLYASAEHTNGEDARE